MGNNNEVTTVYRTSEGGPVMCDGPFGTVQYKFLTDTIKAKVRGEAQRKGMDLELAIASQGAFTCPLKGSDKPEWDYDHKGDPHPQGKFDGGEQSPDPQEGDQPQGTPPMREEGDQLLGMPSNGSQGEGDDQPVMWADFGPWSEQAVKAVSQLADENMMIAETVGGLSVVSRETTKTIDQLKRAVDRIDKRGGGSQGGGAIVRVEIVRPNTPKFDQVGLHHKMFPTLLKLVAAGMHTYLPGPPGTGKSHAASQVAESLGYQFGSISLGPTTPESRLWGGMDAHGNFHEPTFVRGARHAMNHPDSGFVFCLDEMDNGHPGTIATLNSALANGWFTAPNGDHIVIGQNFVLVAAANTYGTGPTAEFSGRNRLDAATLDRFAYLPWETDEAMETALVQAFLAETKDGPMLAAEWLSVWRTCRTNVKVNGLKQFVTMRGAINGAKMLSIGLDVDTVLEAVLLNKMPADQADKVNPL